MLLFVLANTVCTFLPYNKSLKVVGGGLPRRKKRWGAADCPHPSFCYILPCGIMHFRYFTHNPGGGGESSRRQGVASVGGLPPYHYNRGFYLLYAFSLFVNILFLIYVYGRFYFVSGSFLSFCATSKPEIRSGEPRSLSLFLILYTNGGDDVADGFSSLSTDQAGFVGNYFRIVFFI